MQALENGALLSNGAYKVEKSLGQGSFGITYLATQTKLSRKVAIKEFFMKELNTRLEDGSITGMTDGSLSYNYALKFRKEAMNLAQLDHPNIVKVTDSFEENGTFYYVMEFIEGDNLNDYIKQHYMSTDEVVNAITCVGEALKYMHEQKHMLHLDLKPGNIMRRKLDGHIFLIDFGLSKHFSDSGTPETSTTIGLGTAGYAPIEQNSQANKGEFKPTIDVYALGATLYKLLTGKTPPAASDLVSDDDLLLTELQANNVPEWLVNTVIKAMMPNVKKRTQTIADFLHMLKSGTIDDESTQISSTKSVAEEETQVDLSASTKSSAMSNYNEEQPIYDEDDDDGKKKMIIAAICVVAALVIGFFCFKGCSSKQTSEADDNPVVQNADSAMLDTSSVVTESQNERSYRDSLRQVQEQMTKTNDASEVPVKETMQNEVNVTKASVADNSKSQTPQTTQQTYTGKAYDVVEKMPSFPGGQGALMQYLASNVKYPVVAQENGIQGRVVVKFVVEPDGSISNVVVTKSVDPSLDKEAVRVVKSMPKWIPGQNNGEKVRVNFNVPVSFKLQ